MVDAEPDQAGPVGRNRFVNGFTMGMKNMTDYVSKLIAPDDLFYVVVLNHAKLRRCPVYPYRNSQRTRGRMAVVCVDDRNTDAKKQEIRRRGAKFNYILRPEQMPGRTLIFYTKRSLSKR